MRLQLPAAVNMIIDVLQAHGYEGFAVGGCVRDSVLNRTPDDWDITTSATPYQVKELFPKTVDTGLQHGTVTVMVHGVGYEVTTYRIDGEYEDGRHPKEVQFTSNLTEHPEHRGPHRRKPAPGSGRGRRDHQRLHQPHRPAEDPHHQGVR